MTKLTRRRVLLTGTAAAALSACGPSPQSSPAPNAAPNASPETETAPMTPKPKTKFVDGVALAAMIASGETSATAEISAAIARADAVNDKLNAIATKTFDTAIENANALPSGPFQGVPTFMKDLVDWKGAQTLWGSRAFRGNIAAEDSPLSAAWRKTGVASLGKSTSPEMGLISSTEPLVTGPTRNPWDTSRIPGGSSGGAAALVAARVVPFAHASDGGGSIRIPASTCGLFGLKPSASRLAGRAGPTPPVDISINHAVTLTVRDSEALFRIAEGGGGYDPLETISPLSRKLKIGFAPTSPIDSAIAPETTAELERTAELCRTLGHEVIDYVPDMDGAQFQDQFLMYWAGGAAQFAADASRYSGKPIGPDILEPWTLGLAEMFRSRASEMPDVIAGLIRFQAQYASWFENIDVLLTPVTGSPAVPIGEQAPDGDFDKVMESVTRFAAFTAPMNVAGAASMSVPLGLSSSGLPIGSMFSAKKGDDGLLFALAYQLEEARPWIDAIPAVHA